MTDFSTWSHATLVDFASQAMERFQSDADEIAQLRAKLKSKAAEQFQAGVDAARHKLSGEVKS